MSPAFRAFIRWVILIDYRNMVLSVRVGTSPGRDAVIRKLTDIQYERNDINFIRNKFRVRGDVVEIFPSYWNDKAVRIEFFGDEVERISEFTPVTGEVICTVPHVAIYPASALRCSAQNALESGHLANSRKRPKNRAKWFKRKRQAYRGSAH